MAVGNKEAWRESQSWTNQFSAASRVNAGKGHVSAGLEPAVVGRFGHIVDVEEDGQLLRDWEALETTNI